MVTAVAVNIMRKMEIKMSSQSKVSGVKCNLLNLMFCLDFSLSILPLEFYFLKLEELNWMQWSRDKLCHCDDMIGLCSDAVG